MGLEPSAQPDEQLSPVMNEHHKRRTRCNSDPLNSSTHMPQKRQNVMQSRESSATALDIDEATQMLLSLSKDQKIQSINNVMYTSSKSTSSQDLFLSKSRTSSSRLSLSRENSTSMKEDSVGGEEEAVDDSAPFALTKSVAKGLIIGMALDDSSIQV